MKRASLQKIDSFFSRAPKHALQTSIQDSEEVAAPAISQSGSSTLPTDDSDADANPQIACAMPASAVADGNGSRHERSHSAEHECELSNTMSDSGRNDGSAAAFLLDVGSFVGKHVDDFTKRRLLESHWHPAENYSFPYSVHKKGGKEEKRYVSHSHLSKFNWLVLSKCQSGLYCKYCALFTTGSVGGYQRNVTLQKLVTKPLRTFARLLGKDGDLPLHEATRYHKEAVQAAKAFLACADAPETCVANQVSCQRLHQVDENRKRLLPIIDSIIFLGRQGIPFRGHRDDGMLADCSQGTSLTSNEGNFRELLRFRVASGDTELQKHLASTSSRATYISKTTQNELIQCCGEEVLATVTGRVHESGMYSVMFDETTDLAHMSQLSLILRYVHKNVVREDFVQFVDLRRVSSDTDTGINIEEPVLTGKILGEQVVTTLKTLGLDPEKCVGIATDGCSVMVSEICGAVSEIKKHAPNAVHCPCFNHALNLSLSKSCKVQAIRNAVGIMKEVISFFAASSKRNVVLKSTLGGQLKGLCETRWVERHDSVIQFRESVGSVSKALDTIADWKEMQSAAKAKTLRAAISDSEFLVAIVCLADILAHTVPLSRLFQKEYLDVRTARSALADTMTVLRDRREKSEEAFSELYKQASALGEELGTELRSPRIAKRQTHRCNVATANTESYYRMSLYTPLMDNVLSDLETRFTTEAERAYELFLFVPPHTCATDGVDKEAVSAIGERYSAFMGNSAPIGPLLLQAELRLWREKWKTQTEVPGTAVEALDKCDREVFPLIRTLLQVLATLPVSVASAERSFSTLRRLKSWMRTQMAEERLTALALLHTHRDIAIDTQRVIDRFASKARGQRRLDFVI
ncbi:52 kDa repressor of the inhibitor of the protein kinase-like [Ornithodoros turicata]|uniref:52 kDa repressor of the inhibitor of the protein kinase-like n=1 Tax=Ornithodoros turicata TaxID=34597 RepID=UPI0031389A78